MLIIGGENYWATDFEEVCWADSRIRPGCCAAFGLPGANNSEHLVMVCELRDESSPRSDVVRGITHAIAEATGVRCHDVVLIKPRTILKTTSGKIRHAEIKAAYTDGTLKHTLYSLRDNNSGKTAHAVQSGFKDVEADELTAKVQIIVQNVCRLVDFRKNSQTFKVLELPSLPDPEENLMDNGMSSLQVLYCLL